MPLATPTPAVLYQPTHVVVCCGVLCYFDQDASRLTDTLEAVLALLYPLPVNNLRVSCLVQMFIWFCGTTVQYTTVHYSTVQYSTYVEHYDFP